MDQLKSLDPLPPLVTLDEHVKKSVAVAASEELQEQEQLTKPLRHLTKGMYGQQSRMSGGQGAAQPSLAKVFGWINMYEEIIKSELGAEEYTRRQARQEMIFKKGCQKGSFTDVFSSYFTSKKIRSHFESKTKVANKRATHAYGTGSLGYICFEPDRRVPENDFFVKGQVYEVRARFSNSPSSDDDRRVGFRSMAIKLADHPTESPLDLICQTGNISHLFNADSVVEHFMSTEKGGEALKRYLLAIPVRLQAMIEGFRKMPESYSDQHYHSHMTYDLIGSDGVKYAVRFRIVPHDFIIETGRLSTQAQRDTWYFMFLDKTADDISPNYLKTEFAQKIAKTNVRFRLQIQVKDFTEADSNMVYNPAVAWDDGILPWLNLATITLTSPLPDDVTEATKFNIKNHPDVLSIPEASGPYDFKVVAELRQEVYFYTQKLRTVPETTPDGQTVEYLVHVTTGNHKQAGNMDARAEIFLCIIGSERRTPYLKLKRKLKSDFATGARSTFHIHEKYLGEIKCAKVYKVKRGAKSDWLLDNVIISVPYTNSCVSFPCDRWLTDDNPIVTLRKTEASLDFRERTPYLKIIRQLEVAQRRHIYTWAEGDETYQGLPGYQEGATIADLPKDLRFDDERTLQTAWSKHVAAADSFMRTVKNMFQSRKGKLDVEYSKLVTETFGKHLPSKMEHILTSWRDDEEFVFQMINCFAPTKVRQLKEMPSNIPVKDEDLEGLLPLGRSLAQEIKEGNLFMISFPELAEFARYAVSETQDMLLDEVIPRLADDNISIGSLQIESIRTSSIESEGGELHNSVEVSASHQIEQTEETTEHVETKHKTSSTTKSSKSTKAKVKPPKELKKHLCAPVLLIHNYNGRVQPLAIQLTQKPKIKITGEIQPVIYTPKDSGGEYSDWLIAKMWVKVAAAHHQHLSSHLLDTHLLMEPVAMAMNRNLPSVHPVRVVLASHLDLVTAANTVYRQHVMPDDKALAEVLGIGQEPGRLTDYLKKQFSNLKDCLASFPGRLAENGVLEEEELPGFYYRDDALKLWEALQAFLEEVLGAYYENDRDVERDEELQNMMRDLIKNGLCSTVGKVLPDKFQRKKDLIHFLTNVIFRCSIQHSVTGAIMQDMYIFAPNAPTAMMRPPPPAKRGSLGWDEEVVRFLLPPPDVVERVYQMVELMNTPDNKVALGHYPEHVFSLLHAPITRLNHRLDEIDREIKQRNERLKIDYEYFLSENIANNINC